MKQLHLLRHAKAVPKEGALDFDRALAPHGRDQVGRIAHYIADNRVRIDRALVSPSARTRETWSLAKLAAVPVTFDDRIYEASVDMLLAVIKDGGEDASSLLLVGHNPGIHDLARQLVGFGDRNASIRQLADYPTGSLASYDIAAESWRELSYGSARLVGFVTPASLGGPGA